MMIDTTAIKQSVDLLSLIGNDTRLKRMVGAKYGEYVSLFCRRRDSFHVQPYTVGKWIWFLAAPGAATVTTAKKNLVSETSGPWQTAGRLQPAGRAHMESGSALDAYPALSRIPFAFRLITSDRDALSFPGYDALLITSAAITPGTQPTKVSRVVMR